MQEAASYGEQVHPKNPKTLINLNHPIPGQSARRESSQLWGWHRAKQIILAEFLRGVWRKMIDSDCSNDSVA
jgi:hypothetical protein